MSKKTVPPKKAKSKRVSNPSAEALGKAGDLGKAMAKALKAALPPAEELPGNEDIPEPLPGEDVSFSEARRLAMEAHIEARKKATGGLPPTAVEVWFNEFDNSYLYKMGNEYVPAPEKNITRDLRSLGLSEKWKVANHQTEIEWPIWNAFRNRRVKYAGPIPGHRCGLRTEHSGRKLLVTEQARGVWPEDMEKLRGEPTFFTSLFTALLREDGQANHFFYMMAAWLRSLQEGAWTPGPFTWFIGKKDFGKSFGMDFLKSVFGGRFSDPSLPLLTPNAFSGHLLRGEIWVMDDPHLPKKMNEREALATKLKNFFHSRTFTFNDKGKRAIEVNCWRRGIAGINDTDGDMAGLPPMRDGVIDKNTFYRCSDARESWARFYRQKGLPGCGQSEGLDQGAMAQAIVDEVPQVRAWLLSEFKEIPSKWRDDRYGVRAFQHQQLMRDLSEKSPEAKFLSYVDVVLFRHDSEGSYHDFEYSEDRHGDWRKDAVDYPYVIVTSKDLESRMQRSEFRSQVDQRLHLAGKDLGELVKSHPERVSVATMRNGTHRWRINNPFRNTTEEA